MNTPNLATTFYSDPHIQFLSQILQDIGRGELLVPRFQRPFVWLPSQQLELLRSIRQGIPIGAIMVWRTATSQIACYDALGPYALKPGRETGTRDYLLDGVQRLSTLYGALNAPSSLLISEAQDEDKEESEEQAPLRIFFDLRILDFVFLKIDDEIDTLLLPLNILLDSVALLRYQRGLLAHPRAESLVAECDRVAGAFRQYKVPIIPIATDDLALATLTFQRINSQGQKMSDYHMLHALTWSSSFDLMRSLDDLRSEYLSAVGWDGIDEDPILKVLKLILGLDVYKADIEELSSRVANHPTALKSAVMGIANTANFLQQELQIPNFEFVPYTLQTVLLSEILRNFQNLDVIQIELLKNWFWFVTYSEAFTGISDDKVRIALEDMRAMLLAKKPIWRNKNTYKELALPNRFDFRAVRTKSFILNMARSQKMISGVPSGTDMLMEYGRRSIQQIYPASSFSFNERKLASSFGNRVLCPAASLPQLRRAGSLDMDFAASEWLIGDSLDNDHLYPPYQILEMRERRLFKEEASFAESTAGMFHKQLLANDTK